jgi:hypothetical protein
MKPISISRKNFLSSSFRVGATLALAPFARSLFAYSASESESYRKDPLAYAESIGITKAIQKIILTAMLAPNSHNTQPWKVRIDSDSSFTLFGDPARTLPAIDPINRQFFHSQGTFLELARLTADSLMFDAKIAFFPKGIPTDKDFSTKPIAKFSITPKDQCVHDFLFLALPKRQMNRSVYNGDWITQEEFDRLQTLTFPGFIKLNFVSGKDNMQPFFPILIDSFATETNIRNTNEVSRIWFRTSSDDIYTKRDGITLEGNSLSGIKLWFAKKFFVDLSPDGWHTPSAQKAAIDLARSQVESSKGLVFFISEGKDSALEWVKTGIDFMRFTLAIANQNLAFHTMNQALEDYPESLPFHENLKKSLNLSKTSRIQLMGRIGRSDYEFASPRRDMKEILV